MHSSDTAIGRRDNNFSFCDLDKTELTYQCKLNQSMNNAHISQEEFKIISSNYICAKHIHLVLNY